MGGYRPLKPSNSSLLLIYWDRLCTVVPAPLLQRLGIVPQWSAFFELADGRREEYGMSEVRAVLDGEERTTICIFGTPDCQALLGAYTLEGFGLAADPVNGRLVPSSLFLI